MEWANRSFSDNLTEMMQDADKNVSFKATFALRRFRVPSLTVISVSLAVSTIGIIANTLVITVLALARREFKGNVITLIINQSAMDLFSCISLMIINVTILTRGLVYQGNWIEDGIYCVVIQGGVFAAAGMTAGKLGLVVITVERYFKIVHAIAHRKYYHDWMTKVGVVLPWIGGTCLILELARQE